MDTDTILKYEWQQTVLDALLELRPEHLPEKLGVAERTIAERLRDPQPDARERAALSDALHLLHVIFPDWRREPCGGCSARFGSV